MIQGGLLFYMNVTILAMGILLKEITGIVYAG